MQRGPVGTPVWFRPLLIDFPWNFNDKASQIASLGCEGNWDDLLQLMQHLQFPISCWQLHAEKSSSFGTKGNRHKAKNTILIPNSRKRTFGIEGKRSWLRLSQRGYNLVRPVINLLNVALAGWKTSLFSYLTFKTISQLVACKIPVILGIWLCMYFCLDALNHGEAFQLQRG